MHWQRQFQYSINHINKYKGFDRTKDVGLVLRNCGLTNCVFRFVLVLYFVSECKTSQQSKIQAASLRNEHVLSCDTQYYAILICYHLANTILSEYRRTTLNALDITRKTNLNVPNTMQHRLMSNFRNVEFSEIMSAKEIANNSRLKFQN